MYYVRRENLKIEIKNQNGKWIEVDSDYFETEKAKQENKE